MILVVSLNPALDVTHHVAGADWAGINETDAVEVQAGGKGLHVARTLRALGQSVMLTGLAGGLTGHALAGGIAAAGIDSALTQITGETRRIFAVSDTVRGQTASFTEPAPAVGKGEYERFFVAYEKRLKSCAAVVLSGSLPRGLPVGTHADLVAAAVAAGVVVVLDTTGPALRLGAAAGPTMVMASLSELESAAGRSLGAPGRPDLAAVDQTARGLAGFGPADSGARHQPGLGASAVVVSLGTCELLAVCPGGTLLARPPATAARRPAMPGDAAVAGLADGLVRAMSWPELLAHATALEAAAADSLTAAFNATGYRRLLPAVRVTKIGGDLVAGSGLGLVRSGSARQASRARWARLAGSRRVLFRGSFHRGAMDTGCGRDQKMASYRTGARALALVAVAAAGIGGCGISAHSARHRGPRAAATTTTAITPKPCTSGATCWVLVSVATLWASPYAPRPVDQPALTSPAKPGAWVAGMTYADKTGLGGRVVSQVLYGTRVIVIGRRGARWTKIAVPSQPTNLDSRGYPGWVPARQLTSTAPGPARTDALVSSPTAWLWSGWTSAGLAGHQLMDLSYDTTLPVLHATSTYVEVALIGGRKAALARGSVTLHVVGGSWDATGARLVAQARKFLGLQYLWGGTSGFGFDCSGLTHSIYLAYGVVIPRDADRQAAAGTPVAWTALRPGDLVFFSEGTTGVIGHVGIYIGHGDMIDAPSTGSPVRVDPVWSSGNYAGARRYLPG